MYQFAEKAGSRSPPLFLTFHGTGGNENQFHGLAAQLMPQARVISPRGDVMEHGAARFFRRTGEGVYDMDDLATRRDAMADFIRAQRQDGPVIALGYSNGANILAAIMLQHPELVDQAVLMHPLIPWMPAPQPGLMDRRILITAGQHDPICPAAQTQFLADYLQDQGAAVDVDWHPGGHEITQSELAAIQAFLR